MINLIRKSISLTLVALFLTVFNSCEKSKEAPDNDATKSTDEAKIKKDVEVVTEILKRITVDDKYKSLQTESDRFNYVKKVASEDFKIKTDYDYEQFKAIRTTIMSWETVKPSAAARTNWADDPMASYSNGEREFIDFATNSTNSASDVTTFNQRIATLRSGLTTTNFYPFVNYSSDRLSMLDNWLVSYKEYVNQWPEDFDVWNAYPVPPYARTNASCKGFFKKLCIAKWTALFAIAGSAANLGGGTVIAGAAGYLIGRCCKCCSCNVVCAL